MTIASKIIACGLNLGLDHVASFLCRNHPRILMYHRFSKEKRGGFTSERNFDQQLSYISRHYHPMSLSELNHCFLQGKKPPKNAIVITIDDGYGDFYDIAYPLLRKYQIPSTLFITTGFVDNRLWLWPDQVSWLLKYAGKGRESLSIGPVKLLKGDVQAWEWQALIDYLLTVTDMEKHQLIAQIAEVWELDLPVKAPAEYAAVTWQQLREMQESGVEVGGHTVTHPSLGQVDENQAIEEIEGSKRELEKFLGKGERTFCYPNGTSADYNEKIKEVVKRAGFSCSVTAFHDRLGINDQYAMRRFSCGDDMFGFYKSVTGIEHLGNYVRNTIKADYE